MRVLAHHGEGKFVGLGLADEMGTGVEQALNRRGGLDCWQMICSLFADFRHR